MSFSHPRNDGPSIPEIPVLYEDNHLLVIDKPAGLATMGGSDEVGSVHRWAAEYLKHRYHKPGNVFVGIVSRLDRMTTGVLVLARTSKSASRLTIQFGGPGKSKKVSRRAEKTYLALVQGDPVEDSGWKRSGEFVDEVFHDESRHRMRVAKKQHAKTSTARLKYRVVDTGRSSSLVVVRLETGRKHQIRLQWAERGHPILGDQKYGSNRPFESGIALHSWRLLLTHPTTTEPMHFSAPPPHSWNSAMKLPFDEPMLDRVLGDGSF